MITQAPPYPNALKVLIKNAGFSYQELAKEAGIGERTLYDWAAGKRVIPRTEREKLAYLIGCTVQDLAPGITSLRLVQLSHERADEHQQGIDDDMNQTRRLLLRLLGAGVTFLPLQDLLNPEPWQKIAAALQKPASLDKSTLDYFEQLTKWCWHLSNGSDLGTVEQLVASYLPKVSRVAQQPSAYQLQAASIASQGHQLTYVIASQREDFNTALMACKQAHYYGTIARDPNLQAAALIRQGVTYLNRKRPYQTLESYQEALLLVPALSPLLQTRLYAGMAEVQGKLQQEQDALASIRQAHNSFPDHSEKDPATLYIHFNHSSVFLHEGLALLDLHQPIQAAKALEQIDGLHPKMTISERSRIDVLNQQALAAGQQGDLDQFALYMEQAVLSARKLGSDLRISEAWDIHTRMRDQWKYEPRMQSLGNLFAR